ncbi:hypothetical protein GQX74_011164 [Glossina fuscipes]|nr:hypothetical protein GQX74_011164 [Glossina fuscipes]
MEVSDEDPHRASKARLLLQSQIDRKKKREKDKEESREAAKKQKNLEDSNNERGDSSTSSIATVTALRSKKKFRDVKVASKSDFIEKFKAMTEDLYDKLFKIGSTGPEVRSLLSVSNEYEKVLMDLVRENAHLSGRIAELEKDINNTNKPVDR